MDTDDLDRALVDAFHQAARNIKDDPAALERIMRRRSMRTYTRPLRSWSLVLRANDKRIDGYGDGDGCEVREVMRVDAADVRAWCAPVAIDPPGVSLDEAAGLFGVNRTTVSCWASPAEGKTTWWQDVRRQIAEADALRYPPSSYRVVGRRLILDHVVNRANPKRSVTRVWTPSRDGIDPGGEVWSADWGRVRRKLVDQVPADFEQELKRVVRVLGGRGRSMSAATRGNVRSRVMQWVCPTSAGGCGRLVYKLYLPLPSWTLLPVLCGAKPVADSQGLVFRCHHCSGLVYESAERTSSPGAARRGGGRRRVDAWDRFIKRLSAGVLTGFDVRA